MLYREMPSVHDAFDHDVELGEGELPPRRANFLPDAMVIREEGSLARNGRKRVCAKERVDRIILDDQWVSRKRREFLAVGHGRILGASFYSRLKVSIPLCVGLWVTVHRAAAEIGTTVAVIGSRIAFSVLIPQEVIISQLFSRENSPKRKEDRMALDRSHGTVWLAGRIDEVHTLFVWIRMDISLTAVPHVVYRIILIRRAFF